MLELIEWSSKVVIANSWKSTLIKKKTKRKKPVAFNQCVLGSIPVTNAIQELKLLIFIFAMRYLSFPKQESLSPWKQYITTNESNAVGRLPSHRESAKKT